MPDQFDPANTSTSFPYASGKNIEFRHDMRDNVQDRPILCELAPAAYGILSLCKAGRWASPVRRPLMRDAIAL